MASDSANPRGVEERAASHPGEPPDEAARTDSSADASANAEESDPLIGTLLDDRYRIIERLASGGMGVVYRGERVELERPVAIKFLHVGLLANRDSMKRFKREAMTMSKLTHPNCVSVIDIGVSGAAPYIVMDFVTGKTLEDVIEVERRLPPGRAIYLVKQILGALAHAHGKNLVHRDIKPANIMLSGAEGTADHVFVLDFGLAKFNNMRDNNITGASTVLGTPVYMSPEQTKGQSVGPASDIYSAGILLFELLTGDPPFLAENPLETLYMHQGAPVPRLVERAPGVEFSAELEQIVRISLAKKTEERFESAAAFATALDGAPEAISYTPPRLASPRAQGGKPAGKRVRIQERIAFASTQPVTTLDLELEARQRATGAEQRARTPRPASSVETVAMVNPDADPTASQIGRAPTSPSGPNIVVPPELGPALSVAPASSGPIPRPATVPASVPASGPVSRPAPGLMVTVPIAGGPMDSLATPMASPAASMSAVPGRSGAGRRARPRWVLPAIVGACVLVAVMVVLMLSGGGESERPASSVGAGADAGASAAFDAASLALTVDAGGAEPDAAPVEELVPKPAPKIVVKHVKDVEKLITQKRTDEALAGIDKLLRSTHKKNPYLWMLQANLYHDKGYYTKAMALYKKALTKKRKYRKFSTPNNNIIDLLGNSKQHKAATSMFLRVIKKDGLRYLKRAKSDHRSRIVRERAGKLYNRLSGRRRR